MRTSFLWSSHETQRISRVDWLEILCTMKGKHLKFNTHLHCLISPKMENFMIPSRKCWCLTEDANITPLKNSMEHNHEDLVHRNIRWFVLALQPFHFRGQVLSLSAFRNLKSSTSSSASRRLVVVKILWSYMFNQQKSNNKNGTCRIPTTKIPHGTYLDLPSV